MAGSIGVLRVDTPEELSEAFEVVRRAAAMGAQRHGTGALVEQMVVGEEVSIDSAVRGGSVEPLFVARKRLGPAPYFEETGQTIDADDPLLTDPQIVEALERARQAALGQFRRVLADRDVSKRREESQVRRSDRRFGVIDDAPPSALSSEHGSHVELRSDVVIDLMRRLDIDEHGLPAVETNEIVRIVLT